MKENKGKFLLNSSVLILSAMLFLTFSLATAGLVLNLTQDNQEKNQENLLQNQQQENIIIRQYYYDANLSKKTLTWATDFFFKNQPIVSFDKIPKNDTNSLKVFQKTLLDKNQIYKFLATKMGVVDYKKMKYYNEFVIRISTNDSALFGKVGASQLEFEIKNEQLMRKNLLDNNNQLIAKATDNPDPYSFVSATIANDEEAKKIGYENLKAFQDSKFELFLLKSDGLATVTNYQLALLLNLENLELKVVIKTLKTDGNSIPQLRIIPLANSSDRSGIIWKAKYYSS